MRFVDEFRDAGTARALATRIAALCEPGRHYKFMEVCGGHTHTIYKHGLEDYLPETVSLVHGPGCPVCVIPMGRVDDAIAIAEHDDVILTTFGDMLRVPGGRGSFFDSKAAGADIRMVYSPLDALKIARKNPDKRVVFMAIGFETTAPSTAMTVLRAAAEGLDNFSIFCNHVTIIPAIKAILDSPGPAARRLHRARARVDGHRLPAVRVHRAGVRQAAGVRGVRAAGHPAVGVPAAPAAPRGPLRDREPVRPRRAVGRQPQGAAGDRRGDGAAAALRVARARVHRAVGAAGAGEYAAFDAERIFAVPGVRVADPKACQCGEVLKGVLRPWECKVFGTACTPETPIGTCMVSSEGACAAYYNFGRFSRERVKEATRA